MTHISVKEKMREDGIDQKMRKKGNMIRQPSEEEREKGNKEVSNLFKNMHNTGFYSISYFNGLIITTN